MDLVIRIPDELIEPIKDKLPPPEMGILEAVALEALMKFFDRLEKQDDNANRT